MRSQVQVLAGPPTNPAGQSAAGNKPGALAASLGRAGAAHPSPPAHPVGPPGRPPGRQARRRPRTVVAHPAPGRQPRGRCSHFARQPAPVPTAQPPTTGAPHTGLTCLVARGQARPPRPAPNSAARVRHRPPTDQRDVGSVARVSASATVDRAVDGSAATGASTGSGGHGRPATSTWSPTLPPEWEETDASGRMGQTPDGWAPDGWTADGRAPDSGRRSQVAGHRTAGRPDSRTPRPDGWTPDTGHRMPDTNADTVTTAQRASGSPWPPRRATAR